MNPSSPSTIEPAASASTSVADSSLVAGPQAESSYDRHLVFDHVVTPEAAGARERFEAVARTLSDLLTARWLKTEATYDHRDPKRVYYLSMEFLIGRTLVNNVRNLGAEDLIRDDLASDPRLNWTEIVEAEPDAGLGNGGLGRLTACFIESMATLGIPAIGYGLRDSRRRQVRPRRQRGADRIFGRESPALPLGQANRRRSCVARERAVGPSERADRRRNLSQ